MSAALFDTTSLKRFLISVARRLVDQSKVLQDSKHGLVLGRGDRTSTIPFSSYLNASLSIIRSASSALKLVEKMRRAVES